MKKIILFIAVMLSLQNVFACDICGCSSGNYFVGPYPQFNRHFIGLQYSFRSFRTVLNSDNTQYSNDFYQTLQLMAGTNIGYRWQLMFFAPYNINHSHSDDGISNEQGFGDISLLGNYKILSDKSLNKDTVSVSQQWFIGGGLKVPTGKFEVDSAELVSSANSQPGTGSLDFILNSTYILQIGNWGVNSNVNYKINQSADRFKFGNRFSANVFAFRSFHPGNSTLSPNLGLLFENLAANQNAGEKVAQTGGSALMGALGLESHKGKIIMGMNVQLPLFSDFSAGQTDAKVRGMVHVSYIL